MTQTKHTKPLENAASDVIEDLTLDETKTENVKGGGHVGFFVADSFSFGVEREMKESGEKGGTEGC